MNLDSKTMADAVAKLPPPWNEDVESCTWGVRHNSALVECFDSKPERPSRWIPAVEDEDSDGNWYEVRAARKKTRLEFKADVSAYRIALAEWEARRAKGQPIQMLGYVPSGPPTITARVTRKDGSSAVIVGDGERWKVVSEVNKWAR